MLKNSLYIAWQTPKDDWMQYELAFSPVHRQVPAPKVYTKLLKKLEDLAFKPNRVLGCNHYCLDDGY
eukprot:scaffold1289_cov178-Amphora_coffeaeformis.AAC.5